MSTPPDLSRPRPLSLLQEAIGYSFRDPALLQTATTHSSFSNEHRALCPGGCNERLEFLGDSVLSLITGEYLYTAYPEWDEGDLSILRARAVCTEALAGYAAALSLGEYLLLGHGEEKSGGRTKARTLENSFEALLGALYLDGGLAPARALVLPFLKEKIASVADEQLLCDYKSALQQIIQQDGEQQLAYVETGESGPPHARVFHVEARLNGADIIGRGEGRSKRAAEQAAAREALALFGKEK